MPVFPVLRATAVPSGWASKGGTSRAPRGSFGRHFIHSILQHFDGPCGARGGPAGQCSPPRVLESPPAPRLRGRPVARRPPTAPHAGAACFPRARAGEGREGRVPAEGKAEVRRRAAPTNRRRAAGGRREAALPRSPPAALSPRSEDGSAAPSHRPPSGGGPAAEKRGGKREEGKTGVAHVMGRRSQ